MQNLRLTLCISSLFLEQEFLQSAGILDGLQTTELDRFVSRADRREISTVGLLPLLFHLFDLGNTNSQDLPVAPITRLCDGQIGDDYFWLRADPVQLKPDRDRVVMIGNQHLDVSMAEAEALGREFNAFFAEDGFHLEVLAADRWYLRVEKTPQINTTILSKVLGENIDPHLPKGSDALRWHRFLNEAQMLLHNSPVNLARQSRGQEMINSLWFWGGGVLPKASDSCMWQGVWSNEIIATALAVHANIEHGPVAVNATECLKQITPGHHLVVLDAGLHAMQHHDIGAWRDFIKGLNDEWIGPLLKALRAGQLSELQIQSADGTAFTLTVRGLRRWWKRNHSFSQFGSL